MSAQVDHGRSHSQQHRPQHLNMSIPLNPRTLDTIQCEITKEMIASIAMHARNVIPCTPAPALTSPDRISAATAADPDNSQCLARSGSAERLPSPPATPGAGTLSNIPPLDVFITNLVLRSRVQAGTLICTLVYLQRLRHRLPKEARGMECTCHRIFLAALIVAGKYLNDASPKNKYWARYSTMFTVAEVNLMEKQLLFLLDFDLRIDNVDLNEAASAFHSSSSKHAAPLTPTTPPFSSSISHSANVDSAAHTSSQYKTDSSNSEINPDQKSIHPHVYPETAARVYPTTLGLGNHAECSNHTHRVRQQKGQVAQSVDRRMSHQLLPPNPDHESTENAAGLPNVSRQYSTTTHQDGSGRAWAVKSHDRRTHTDIGTLQFSFDPKAAPQNLGYKQRSGSVSASLCDPMQQRIGPYHQGVSSQAGPLQQLSANEQLHLLPSPKKRAVSRGHHSNIPHPSPIYHHGSGSGSGVTSTAGTAAPSAATSSSAYFLQPLEQAHSSYARSRYQQQRYDPGASRNAGSRGGVPRMAISIPSLRKSTRTDSPELGLPVNGSAMGRKTQKGRHILRHQSTAPDIGKISSMVSDPSSIPFIASLAHYSKNTHSGQPHRNLATNDTDAPVRPLPARLASAGSSAMDASPVHTLVYEESPAASLGMAASEGYSQRMGVGQEPLSSDMRVEPGDSNERTLTAPPVTALSELSFGAHMHTAGANCSQSRRVNGSLAPSSINNGSSTADANSSICDSTSGDSNSSGSGTGWQLKTKLLHPLSAWFRLSRHHHHSQQSPGAHKQHDISAQAPYHCDADVESAQGLAYGNGGGGAFSTCSKNGAASKGASAPSLAPARLRDRGLGTCSLSPVYLEPPVAPISAPAND
ncbi:PHO85 cyclin-1 [Coemansia sp. RSA 1933]|nr:PHO85 cyclin-1 [Coemansia sp. RSA 1933]